MNQETKRALGYSETEPTSKAKFRPLLDYGIAMLAVGLAVLLQFVLTPWFEGSPDSSPFLLFFAAVMVAAWFGGLGAGLLATVLSALLSNYFFLVPQYTIQSAIPTQSLRLAAFVLEGVLISALVGALHDARRRAEANALKVKLDEEELRVRARQQQAVAELGRRALAETDLQAFMGEAVSLTAGVLNLEYCTVMELLPGGEKLLLRAGVGWEEGRVGRATEEAGLGSPAGYTLRSDEPVIAEDLRAETRFSASGLLSEHGAVSGMSVVVGGSVRPYGVLSAHARKRRTFSEDDVNFLQAVAHVLAAAIERQRAEETQRFLAEAGEVLSSSLDYLHRRGAHEPLSAKNPKVVLLDLKLPKVDGLEGLGRIKIDSDLKTIPVVMLTSSREERDLLRSYNLGMNAYVVKPMSFTDFIKAVKEVGLFWGVINQSIGIVEWKT